MQTAKAGFSLTEIMVAIFVMAIFGTLALGSYGRSVQRAKTERTASRLSHELKAARSKAISLNRDVLVELSTSANTLTVWADDNRDQVQDSSEVEVIALGSSGEVSLSSTWSRGWYTPVGQFVSSQQSRTISSQTTTISSRNGKDSASVTIAGGGSVVLSLSLRS